MRWKMDKGRKGTREEFGCSGDKHLLVGLKIVVGTRTRLIVLEKGRTRQMVRHVVRKE